MIRLLLLLPVFILIFNACKTALTTIAPGEEMNIHQVSKKSSTLTVPVELAMKNLEDLINREFSGLIYADNSFDDHHNDNLKLRVWKRDYIVFSIHDRIISYQVPMKLSVQLKKLVALPEINGEITMRFKTSLTLNKDWSVTAVTKTDGYQWISSPTMTIAGFDISIRYIGDILLKVFDRSIISAIDEKLAKNLHIRDLIAKLWNDIQEPFLLDQNLNAWLSITPLKITSTQITSDQNIARILVGLETTNDLVIGHLPASRTRSDLPILQFIDTSDPSFIINMNLEATFEKINEMASEALVGQWIREGNKKARIERIRIYGSHDLLIAEVGLSGSVSGNVYLETKPYYDPINRIIIPTETDFVLQTRNVLMRSASWLLKGALVKMLNKEIRLQLHDQLEQIMSRVNAALDQPSPVSGLIIDGKLHEIDFEYFRILQQSVMLGLSMKGYLKMKLDPEKLRK